MCLFLSASSQVANVSRVRGGKGFECGGFPGQRGRSALGRQLCVEACHFFLVIMPSAVQASRLRNSLSVLLVT